MSLEERAVIQLINALRQVIAVQSNQNSLMIGSLNLISRVHGVVSEMAVDNAELVDINFCMEYLNGIGPVRNRGLD